MAPVASDASHSRRFRAAPGVRLASLSALASLALTAALLAPLPADEARAHNNNRAAHHDENSPLHKAAKAGDLDSVNHFIAVHGVTVNVTDGSSLPLFYAVENGHVSVVAALIAAGADVKDYYLHYAARNGHVSVVAALIAAGADVNVKDSKGWAPWPPLLWAARSGHVSVVSALIAAGADVNAKTRDDWTPLHLAASNGHVSVVSALIAAGADLNAKTNFFGNSLLNATPLHYAAWDGHVSVVSAFIAAGADLNVKGDDDWTPLHYAASEGHTSIVSALIAAEADVNIKTTAAGRRCFSLHPGAMYPLSRRSLPQERT